MKTSTKIFASAAAAVAMFFTTNASAQKLGIGADIGIPTNSAYSFAGGLDARIQFNVTKQLSVPITTGYTHFWAKDRYYTALGENTPDYAYIPLKTGLKYFLAPSGSGTYIMGEVSAATSYNYSNGVLNKTTLATYAPAINFYKSALKKYDINGSFGPTYTTNESSLQKDINGNGWGAKGNLNVFIFLPAHFAVSTNDTYEYQGRTQAFNTNFSKLIINTAISKKFLKNEGLKILLSANDLLNQNVGFNRTASGSMMTQNSYTTIKRYFMASISWDFSQMGGAPAKK